MVFLCGDGIDIGNYRDDHRRVRIAMIWLAVISAAWFTGVLIANLTRDGRRFRQGLPINHNNRSWVRFFWLSPCIGALTWTVNGHFSLSMLWQLPYTAIMVGLLW